MKKTKKILVIDDSAFMRRVISDIINSDLRCETIGTAVNGEDGLKKVLELQPDLIILDIEMPIMNGLTMLKKLKTIRPTPVIMMSTLAKEGAKETMQALELGAIDFVTKPTNIFKVNTKVIKTLLIEKILLAANVNQKKIDSLRLGLPTSKMPRVLSNIKKNVDTYDNKIIAIGCSTGGPSALQGILPYLPADIDAGIVIVQHMPRGFTKSLADRLNQLSNIEVKEAEDNEIINKGIAYLAPGNYHMRIIQKFGRQIIKLTQEPLENGHRPAVDIMLDSLTSISNTSLYGIIMTGMGTDGLEGFRKLKKTSNINIIAQNEDTCVVYGMPKAVVENGLADEILPLQLISDIITRKVGVH